VFGSTVATTVLSTVVGPLTSAQPLDGGSVSARRVTN
jgi:hypothetical protein